MPLEVEINYHVNDFETYQKWFGLAFKDKQPTKSDERAYHKLSVLIDSLKYDEEMEKLDE